MKTYTRCIEVRGREVHTSGDTSGAPPRLVQGSRCCLRRPQTMVALMARTAPPTPCVPQDLDAGRLPQWTGAAAPQIGINYWWASAGCSIGSRCLVLLLGCRSRCPRQLPLMLMLTFPLPSLWAAQEAGT